MGQDNVRSMMKWDSSRTTGCFVRDAYYIQDRAEVLSASIAMSDVTSRYVTMLCDKYQSKPDV